MSGPPLHSDLPARVPLDERLLPDAGTTDRFAAALAPLLRAGDCLCLDGDLGAGKTHFARAVIQVLLAAQGQAEDVPSPSFTLVQTYRAGALEIWHSDLYRLSDPSELDELGLSEAFGEALCLVEWPTRMAEEMPPEALWLRFAMTDRPGQRRVQAESARPERWQDRLATALAAL